MTKRKSVQERREGISQPLDEKKQEELFVKAAELEKSWRKKAYDKPSETSLPFALALATYEDAEIHRELIKKKLQYLVTKTEELKKILIELHHGHETLKDVSVIIYEALKEEGLNGLAMSEAIASEYFALRHSLISLGEILVFPSDYSLNQLLDVEPQTGKGILKK